LQAVAPSELLVLLLCSVGLSQAPLRLVALCVPLAFLVSAQARHAARAALRSILSHASSDTAAAPPDDPAPSSFSLAWGWHAWAWGALWAMGGGAWTRAGWAAARGWDATLALSVYSWRVVVWLAGLSGEALSWGWSVWWDAAGSALRLSQRALHAAAETTTETTTAICSASAEMQVAVRAEAVRAAAGVILAQTAHLGVRIALVSLAPPPAACDVETQCCLSL